MTTETQESVEWARMGRCARLAWEHGLEERGKSRVERPGLMTGHILLGVLKEDDCAGGLILAKMGLNLKLAYAKTQFVLLHGRRRDTPEEPTADWASTPHTPAAKTTMELALEEAALFSATYPIGTEHMLLGLLRVPDGIGCKVLNYFGIEVHGARAARDEFWDLLRLAE